MIKSMTGYGKCEKQTDNLGLSLELRTLNSRYLDFSHRLPKALLPFEDDALKLIKNRCIRGKVILSVKIEYFGNEQNNFVLNQDKLKNYMILIDQIKDFTSMSGSPSINDVLSFPDIIKNETGTLKIKFIILSPTETLSFPINEPEK